MDGSHSTQLSLHGKQSASEMYEQQIYELRKQLHLSQTMEKEYMVEMEVLQKKYDTDLAAERTKLKALEDKYTINQRELMSELESQVQEKRVEAEFSKQQKIEAEEKVKKLETQLKHLTEVNNSNLVQQLQIENAELKEKVSQLCEECFRLKEENRIYQSRVEEMNSELIELKDRNKEQKEELAANSDTILNLREEVVLLKSELHTVQSKPQATDQKGNSLFAEVEDKRRSMKKNLETAINKYKQMKNQYADKCAEASKYRAEYVFLCRKWEEMETTLKEEDKQLINALKTRIKFLEEEVQRLTNLKPPYVIENADNSALKFIEAYAESSRKECEKLKKELDAMSVKVLFNSENLHEVQRKLYTTEKELMQARGQIVKLQGELQEKEGNPGD